MTYPHDEWLEIERRVGLASKKQVKLLGGTVVHFVGARRMKPAWDYADRGGLGVPWFGEVGFYKRFFAGGVSAKATALHELTPNLLNSVASDRTLPSVFLKAAADRLGLSSSVVTQAENVVNDGGQHAGEVQRLLDVTIDGLSSAIAAASTSSTDLLAYFYQHALIPWWVPDALTQEDRELGRGIWLAPDEVAAMRRIVAPDAALEVFRRRRPLCSTEFIDGLLPSFYSYLLKPFRDDACLSVVFFPVDSLVVGLYLSGEPSAAQKMVASLEGMIRSAESWTSANHGAIPKGRSFEAVSSSEFNLQLESFRAWSKGRRELHDPSELVASDEPELPGQLQKQLDELCCGEPEFEWTRNKLSGSRFARAVARALLYRYDRLYLADVIVRALLRGKTVTSDDKPIGISDVESFFLNQTQLLDEYCTLDCRENTSLFLRALDGVDATYHVCDEGAQLVIAGAKSRPCLDLRKLCKNGDFAAKFKALDRLIAIKSAEGPLTEQLDSIGGPGPQAARVVIQPRQNYVVSGRDVSYFVLSMDGSGQTVNLVVKLFGRERNE